MFVGGWGWWPDYNDPWNQLDPNFSPKDGDGISNGGWWVNERFSELMALSAELPTPRKTSSTWMKEIQNILTEQDPPVIYYGETALVHGPAQGHQGLRPEPALPRLVQLRRHVPGSGRVARAFRPTGLGEAWPGRPSRPRRPPHPTLSPCVGRGFCFRVMPPYLGAEIDVDANFSSRSEGARHRQSTMS